MIPYDMQKEEKCQKDNDNYERSEKLSNETNFIRPSQHLDLPRLHCLLRPREFYAVVDVDYSPAAFPARSSRAKSTLYDIVSRL
jgi:hypothetical protein